jgi:transcriptional regulator with XRE-family HTH domain
MNEKQNLLPAVKESPMHRKDRGLTQESLANEVGIPRSEIANIEVGRQGVFAEQIRRFAVVLDMPVQKLNLPEPA